MKALKVSSRFNLSTIFLVVMILFVTFAAYKFGRLSAAVEKTGSTDTDYVSEREAARLGGAETKADGGVVSAESRVRVLSWRPRVFHHPGFLSREEADHLVALGAKHVERSKVVGAGGKDQVDTARTSYGTFFVRSEQSADPVVVEMEKRIAKWTHMPRENGEHFYLLRYENGQEYKPHFDFFSADHANLDKQGNRMATVLLYLSDVEEGGETIFPNAKPESILVAPKKGDAVLFWDMDTKAHTDPDSLHGGKPVIKGTKWVLTKWIRQNRYRHDV